MAESNSNKKSQHGEITSAAKKPTKDILSHSKKEELVHDLKMKKIQIEIQKQKLLQHKVQFGLSINKHSDLYEFASVGYLTLDEHGIISETNLTACNLIEIERESIYNLPFINFLKTNEMKKFKNDLSTAKTMTYRLLMNLLYIIERMVFYMFNQCFTCGRA